MKVRQITFPEREIWNNFVSQTPECPILQSFEWGEFKAKFGWQPLRFAVEDAGEIVGGIQILKRPVPYIKHSILYAPRGPVINYKKLPDRETVRRVIEFLLTEVEKEAEEHRAISLKIDPAVSEKQIEELDLLNTLGFEKAPKQIQPRATFIVNLRRSNDTILASFEEKTRYNIRLAQRKGVVVQEDPSEKGLNVFYQLYQETANRDKFLIHPLRYYQLMRDILFTKGLGTNFIAYYEGKPIAAVIIFCFGQRVWYMYGASSAEHRNVMPNHLLHWRVIEWAREKKYKKYDLWGIPANPKEGHPLWGVYRFKKGFNGKLVKYIGALNFPYSPLFYNIFEYGVEWWRSLRRLIKKGKIQDSLSE